MKLFTQFSIDFSPSVRLLSHKLSLVSLADIVKLELGNFDKDFGWVKLFHELLSDDSRETSAWLEVVYRTEPKNKVSYLRVLLFASCCRYFSEELALSRQGLSRPGEQRKQGQTAIDAAETVRIFSRDHN